MLRIVLLSLGAALLFASSAHAHGYHGGCAVGDTWMGVVPHFHPGGYGKAIACGGGGGGYYEAPPQREYYGDGYRRGYGGGRPGDYGPQTNRAQDCYNVYGNRICCPKGWTVQDGQCAPYRGR